MPAETDDLQTATIEYTSSSPNNCPFVPSGPFYLENGNSLDILFSGFPGDSTFTLLTLQSTVTSSKYVHYPSQPGDTPGIFSITSSGDQPPTELKITITDVEKPASEDIYNLSLTGNNWSSDPEVINKPGG